MSTAIVTQNTQHDIELANATMAATGFEDVRLKPTNIELVQRTSRVEGAIPGKLRDVLTGAHFDTIEAVPLRIFKGRVMFPPGGDLNAEPICRSNDGVVPSKFAKFPQAANCKACPKGQWVNGQKPACSEKWRVLLINRETGLPRYLTVGGMSLKPLKLLTEQIKQDIEMAKYKGQIRLPYGYAFTIGSQFVQGQKGSYYILKFTDVKYMSNPDEFGPLFKEYVMRSNQQIEEQMATQDAENVKNSATSEIAEAEYVEA